MPIRYKKNTRRPRRRRKKNNKKKYSVSVSRLASKKIDTLLERRMVQIVQSQKQTLVNRKWITQPLTFRNAPPILGELGENYSSHPYVDITSRPYISEWIDVIKAADINQPLNQPDPANPDGAGVTRGMYTEPLHGYRRGNTVKVKGISLDMRIISDFGMEALHNTDNNEALEIISRNFTITRGRIFLEYKVVQVSVSNTNQALPPPEEIAVLALKYNNFGYSPQLDVAEKEKERFFKYKTLISGRINCSPQISFSKHGRDVAPVPLQNEDPTVNVIPFFKEIKQYRAFNPPIQIDYAATDQLGKTKTRTAIYFIAKSNYDASNAGNPQEQSCVPRIAVISKLYYYDN